MIRKKNAFIHEKERKKNILKELPDKTRNSHL